MSANYDNWERLVAAVLKREEIWQLCHQHSRNTSICSESSDFSSISFQLSDVSLSEKNEEYIGKPFSKLVFLGGSNPGHRLKDILKDVRKLGNGRFGTSVLTQLLQDVRVSDNVFLYTGTRLVMKLLKQVSVTEDEFIQQMMVFQSCRHENVAAPMAYYFSDKANGKLIIYDYFSQGNMLQEGGSRVTWESRLKMAIGAARGIAHIHAQCGGKLAHGNINSSNIFFNSKQYGCVSDFSLAGIMEKPPVLEGVGHHAAAYFHGVSQETDVLNFGNFLLELLTGKSPLEAQGFEKDLELVTWVRSIKYKEWTSKLFDESLKRQIRNKNDLFEMAKTEIPGVDFDSATNIEALRAILRSHFHSMNKIPHRYFLAQDLVEMIETLHVALRCFPLYQNDIPKMSDIVLMLENIATMTAHEKPQQTIERALNSSNREDHK